MLLIAARRVQLYADFVTSFQCGIAISPSMGQGKLVLDWFRYRKARVDPHHAGYKLEGSSDAPDRGEFHHI